MRLGGCSDPVCDFRNPGNRLAEVSARFPAYYAVGFTLVGIALVCALLQFSRSQSRSIRVVLIVLPALAVCLMIIDWCFVFTPLLDLMEFPDARERPGFKKYHNWSKYLNALSVGLCAVGAVISLREIQFHAPDSVSPIRESVE